MKFKHRLGVFWYNRTESIPFEPDTVDTVVGKAKNDAARHPTPLDYPFLDYLCVTYPLLQ